VYTDEQLEGVSYFPPLDTKPLLRADFFKRRKDIENAGRTVLDLKREQDARMVNMIYKFTGR
jgi:hypothetical protein